MKAIKEYVCPRCKHWLGGSGCAAFGLEPIPKSILSGESMHEDPVDGDGGKTFEPLKPVEKFNLTAGLINLLWDESKHPRDAAGKWIEKDGISHSVRKPFDYGEGYGGYPEGMKFHRYTDIETGSHLEVQTSPDGDGPATIIGSSGYGAPSFREAYEALYRRAAEDHPWIKEHITSKAAVRAAYAAGLRPVSPLGKVYSNEGLVDTIKTFDKYGSIKMETLPPGEARAEQERRDAGFPIKELMPDIHRKDEQGRPYWRHDDLYDGPRPSEKPVRTTDPKWDGRKREKVSSLYDARVKEWVDWYREVSSSPRTIRDSDGTLITVWDDVDGMQDALETWFSASRDMRFIAFPGKRHRAHSTSMKKLVEQVEALDKLLSVAPIYDGTVWRGMRVLPDNFKNYEVGAEMTWPSHTSTTSDEEVAHSFANRRLSGDRQEEGRVFFRIENHRGAPVSAIRDHASEDEVLLPRGSRFRIKNMEQQPGTRGKVFHIITLEGIDEDE